MKKTSSIIMLITSIIIMTASAQKKEVSSTEKIPYQIVSNYFVKNNFKKEHFTNPKITTQKDFDALFGAAAFMGKKGEPTAINFAKQYIIAVTIRETNYITTITPVSLKKIANKIVFTANVSSAEKTTSTTKPILLIAVNKKYTGKIETKIEEKKQVPNGLPISSQWILESFNADFQLITKNTYITLSQDLTTFTGNGGCNMIKGSLKVSQNKIKFSKITGTEMFCSAMNQESKFTSLLAIANTYKINGAQFFLYQDDKLLMTLESYR
ncbi:META domain-containing protein [Flavobacterium psychrophilum]|uniref:META domain-containing protein n=1 Tax=Flavobacterium psychrophilum TaxID=96345 RepID=UPI001D09036A|nr:META domain-containing protein [Flavobacterium psychrophilum]MCB6099234.1 META domain-containing protein [Flavobacterium psychrophilum]